MELFSDNNIFIEVILPLPLPKLFTYRVPLEISPMAQVGARVVVPFGKRKVLTGIIANTNNTPPTEYQAKYIIDILDSAPLLSKQQLDFYTWIAEYYLCHLGEVINIALPSGFKINSESYIGINPERPELSSNDAYHELIFNYLQENELVKYEDLEAKFNKTKFVKIIHELLQAEQVILIQKTDEKYSPKFERRIRISPELFHDIGLNEINETLANKKKQAEVISCYLETLRNKQNNEGISKPQLIQSGISRSSIATLVKNGILEEFEVQKSRIKAEQHIPKPINAHALNTAQEKSLDEINSSFKENKPVLLHGITGSGKTEIYFKLIEDVLKEGKQALFLLPEIALTTQMIERVSLHFGNSFGIYHSRFSDNERVEIWKSVENSETQLVIGVRSSIFLPFKNLGLIIIDEEHDNSYKQTEPAPRYNARDAAHILASQHKANIVLGSATPSYESYHQATVGKWSYVELNKRFKEAKLPQIEILSNQYQYVEGNFKNELYKSIATTVESEQQAIIFKNRRGYSPYIKCKTCDHIVLCPNCNVSLTYHNYSNECRCHYCSYSIHIPQNCAECGSKELETLGQGTEKIEDEINHTFPEIRVERMDYETTRKKNSYKKIINNFANGYTQVLVGTQMVTKGLDFANVSLVGVYDADFMLNFPDYKAKEKTYQTLTQVAGRAGRAGQESKVLIQSNTPESTFFDYIKSHGYKDLFNLEIEERKLFLYPPFTRMVKVIVKNENRDLAIRTASAFYDKINMTIHSRLILGPQEPLINKVRNMFIVELQIKLLKDEKLTQNKKFILAAKTETEQLKQFRKSFITLDVDP